MTMTSQQTELSLSVSSIYTDFFENFPNTDSISSVVGAVQDLHDQLAEAVARTYPGADLGRLAVGLIRANAAVTACLELPEVISAAANGGNVAQQVAGMFGAILGGYIGAEIGFALGAGVAGAFLGPGVLATAIGVAAAVSLAWALSVGFEGIVESLIDLFSWHPIDPLVIDLDGDGIELTALDGSNAYFDLDGDGFAENTGWVGVDDALLAIDLNGNGKIDDISELFGSETATGYEELAAFDTDGNGVVNAQDANFSQLLVWRDLDGDGETDAGELQTLTDAGIAAISASPTPMNTNVNGNTIVETAMVTMTDGSTTTSGEALFRLSQVESTYILPDNFSYDSEVFTLPILKGFGEIADLWVAMSEDASLKQGARDLIATARGGDFAGFKADFDAMLAEWAGVQNAVWLQDAPVVSAVLVFDADAFASDYDFVSASGGSPLELPPVRGYIFITGNPDSAYQAEIDAWLAGNDYVVPGLGGNLATGPGIFSVSINGAVLGAPVSVSTRGPTAITGQTFGGTDPDPAPAMDATAFAFLQKLMGQDYSQGVNYITPENLLVANPDAQQVAALQASYDDVKDYMMARFLARPIPRNRSSGAACLRPLLPLWPASVHNGSQGARRGGFGRQWRRGAGSSPESPRCRVGCRR